MISPLLPAPPHIRCVCTLARARARACVCVCVCFKYEGSSVKSKVRHGTVHKTFSCNLPQFNAVSIRSKKPIRVPPPFLSVLRRKIVARFPFPRLTLAGDRRCDVRGFAPAGQLCLKLLNASDLPRLSDTSHLSVMVALLATQLQAEEALSTVHDSHASL